MKLTKIESNEVQCSAISVKYDNGEDVGLILCSQEFIPVAGVELSINDLTQVLAIVENFKLFYNNI